MNRCAGTRNTELVYCFGLVNMCVGSGSNVRLPDSGSIESVPKDTLVQGLLVKMLIRLRSPQFTGLNEATYLWKGCFNTGSCPSFVVVLMG